jgi:hypothetical protein
MKLSYLHTSKACVVTGCGLYGVSWTGVTGFGGVRVRDVLRGRVFVSQEIYRIRYFCDYLRLSFVSRLITSVRYIRKHCSKYEPVLYLRTTGMLSAPGELTREHSTHSF